MSAPLKLLVLCPHFEPDTAPTGVVMTRIVHELAELGHEIHVVTALPWYREHKVESEWVQTTWKTRTSVTAWGSVTRLNPFAGDDKKNLWRRALGFVGFSAISVVAGLRAGRASGDKRRVDAVIAMYHDQGLIPFKTLAFMDGVNVTAGLPIVRTSPDHGTAYDIAGTGVADTSSFRAAVYDAIHLVRNRNQFAEDFGNPLDYAEMRRERFRIDF